MSRAPSFMAKTKLAFGGIEKRVKKIGQNL